jgi:site-specific DNA recombinase
MTTATVYNFDGRPAEPLTHAKPAAIWARVSTSGQAETSLPSQIERCRAILEEAGYSAIHTFAVDWSSLDLYSCPEFQQLGNLVRNHEITAVAALDRDRFNAQGKQRLIFLWDLKEAGVSLLLGQGPPIMDGSDGELMEFVYAIGKEKQVLRARQGSKDGLHDRVVKFRKPICRHKLYGYNWDETGSQLVKNDEWPNLKLIFDMLLNGASYTPIIRELGKRGILSPSGREGWNKTALSNIVHNPVYAGRYFALKKVAVPPKKRKTKSYGNSSCRKLPLEQAHYLPEVVIVDPPINWEQRARIVDQLARHQKLAARNAKREYLLRGILVCGSHRGKGGQGRRYHGQPHPHNPNSWRYVCPEGGCPHSHLDGPQIERWLKGTLITMLYLQPDELYQWVSGLSNREQLEATLKKDLEEVEARCSRGVQLEASLEVRYAKGEIDEDVYPLVKARYRNERQYAKARRDEILAQLGDLGRTREAIDSIEEIKGRLIVKHMRDQITYDQWRQLFETLNVEVHVKASGEPALVRLRKRKGGVTEAVGVPLELWLGVPIRTEAVKIALANPVPG